MSQFNNDEYLKTQVDKQYTHEVMSPNKHKLSIPEVESLIDIYEDDLEALQNKVKSGQLTYLDIMKYFIKRIQDHQSLNAIISLNPYALEEARNKVYDQANHMVYGLPVLVKDNITTSHMNTTAGAAVLKDYISDDCQIIKNLKEKGAIILGKTNLSEWANFMSTSSSNGYSAVGGQCHNPYGHFDVGGSSAGSAVAAAARLAPLCVGTETAGSIIYPASQNSVVGLKPSIGRVSNDKIIPISPSHDTAGPMTRYVKDTYYLFQALTHVQTIDFDGKNDDLSIGLICNEEVVSFYREDDEKILDECIKVLEPLSYKVHPMYLKSSAFETKVYDILKYEFREGIKDFFSEDKYIEGLDDIIAFNEKHMQAYAPYNHEIIVQAARETYDEKVIKDQLALNTKLTRQALDHALKDYDLLMTLSNYCTSVYAPAGYPAISIPMAYRSSGEPIGLTLIAGFMEDEKLIRYAYQIERQIKHVNPKE